MWRNRGDSQKNGKETEAVRDNGERQWSCHEDVDARQLTPGHLGSGDLELVLLWPPASTFWVPRSPMCATKPVLGGAGMEPRASCMLGRYSADNIPSPLRRFQTWVYEAPKFKILNTNDHIKDETAFKQETCKIKVIKLQQRGCNLKTRQF